MCIYYREVREKAFIFRANARVLRCKFSQGKVQEKYCIRIYTFRLFFSSHFEELQGLFYDEIFILRTRWLKYRKERKKKQYSPRVLTQITTPREKGQKKNRKSFRISSKMHFVKCLFANRKKKVKILPYKKNTLIKIKPQAISELCENTASFASSQRGL